MCFFVVPNSFRYFGINKFETNQRRTAHRRLAMLGDHESMWPRFLTTVLPQEIISSVCNRFLGITTSQGHCQWWSVEAGEGNHPKKIEEQLVFVLNYIVYREYVFCIIRIRLMLFHFPKSKEKHKEVTFWKTHRISNSKHWDYHSLTYSYVFQNSNSQFQKLQNSPSKIISFANKKTFCT